MNHLNTHVQRTYVLALTEEEVKTIVMAIGMTSLEERQREARDFYELEEYQDEGQVLFDELTDLLDMGEKFDFQPPASEDDNLLKSIL